VTTEATQIATVGGVDRVSGGGTGGSDCYALPATSKGNAIRHSNHAPHDLSPDAQLVSVYCGGRFVGNRWVEPSNIVDVDAEARRVAQHWAATVPAPDVTIATAPPARTVTGLATWFWADGYRGQPLAETLDAFGYPVEVRMDPSPVTWDFGDGATAQGGFGRPYPQPSDIQHTFQHRSTSNADPDGAFTVALRFELTPTYRVDHGPWQTLDPITVTDQRPLTVREIQAVITDQ
jgi:hypothetical protein